MAVVRLPYVRPGEGRDEPVEICFIDASAGYHVFGVTLERAAQLSADLAALVAAEMARRARK